MDWTLLKNLQTLDEWLRANGLQPEVSHSLIGKYVYLHYLRDRDILSDRKLEAWKIAKESVFGRNATLKGLQRVIARLDDWLNGSVFPLEFKGTAAPDDRHVQWVAATFAGDEPRTKGKWQLHLDFQAYDFSYIPIETLSVVYEQFLHAPSGAMHCAVKRPGRITRLFRWLISCSRKWRTGSRYSAGHEFWTRRAGQALFWCSAIGASLRRSFPYERGALARSSYDGASPAKHLRH